MNRSVRGEIRLLSVFEHIRLVGVSLTKVTLLTGHGVSRDL